MVPIGSALSRAWDDGRAALNRHGRRLPHPTPVIGAHGRDRPRLQVLKATFLILLLLPQATQAGPIVSDVGLLSRVIFTDNLFLTNQGQDSAAIFQLLPNVTGGRNGNRTTYRYFYGPSAVFYGGGNSDLNRVFQVLQANASVAVVKDYFWFELSANANQNLIDPGTENAGFNALGNPNAFAQTASISVTPVIQFPIRTNFATVRIAPGINYVFSTETANGATNAGSTGTQSYLTITSGAYFSRMSWQITGSRNIFNNLQSNQDTQNYQYPGTSSLYLTLTYPFTAQWSVQGLAGYDWGDYQSLSNTGGARWRVTPYWSPSRNTSIGLGYGWRYYGTDYYANIQHRFRKTAINISYETVVSSASSALLNANVVYFQDPFGVPITNPAASQALSGSIANPALVSGVFVQHQLLANITHQFGRTNANLSLNQNRWDYQDSDNQVDGLQADLAFNRSLSRRSSVGLGVQYWEYSQSYLGAADFIQYQLWTQYSYQINRKLTGNARYYHNQRTSDAPSQNYDENALWLTLNWTL